MLDNHDVAADQTTDTASHESDLLGSQLIDLLARRRSVAPLWLSEPGPSPDEVQKLPLSRHVCRITVR
jgi:hypothetical protein